MASPPNLALEEDFAILVDLSDQLRVVKRHLVLGHPPPQFFSTVFSMLAGRSEQLYDGPENSGACCQTPHKGRNSSLKDVRNLRSLMSTPWVDSALRTPFPSLSTRYRKNGGKGVGGSSQPQIVGITHEG